MSGHRNRDEALRREAAQEKLHWVAKQLGAVKPTLCIPFASFSIFAHEENAYLNDERNGVDDAVEVIERCGVTPVVLYPGDRWTVGAQHDNAEAIKRYAEADDVSNRPLRSHTSVRLEDLQRLAEDYRQRVRSRNNRALLWLASSSPMRKPARWPAHPVIGRSSCHSRNQACHPRERCR